MIQFQFDDSKITVQLADPIWQKKYEVRVTEGTDTFELLTNDGGDLVLNAGINTRAVKNMDPWTADRIVFCFGIAARKILNSEI